ncbi:pilus assembly PilX family protein [Pseudoduganella sp. OTU4001]|uniref:pilus assembly PilX family protein n=1 Tax=Pseudoduganella sp. OTU4001 TaxID=3043854 RepID=UPI00313E6708
MRTPIDKLRRQRGMSVPIMLIMLGVMLVSSIYLLRSSNSTTLTAANLAYETALAKAADAGIHQGYAWLAATPRSTLWNDVLAAGYRSTTNPAPGKGPSDKEYWYGSAKMTDSAGNQVEYVIHRLCTFAGPFDQTQPANSCALTSAKQDTEGRAGVGDSLSSDAPAYQGSPQISYVITARISGARGGNVMNQAVVMMGP